ncbi:MAG: ABC transporter permease subunit [Clostridia bacterium]|nr:ABC transporter permease subunit [Clostridia bacterium]
MKAIYKRELRAYFKTPVGYIFLSVFIFFAALMFVFINMGAQQTSMSSFFSNVGLIFVFVIPVLTMRLFSEERKSKTDQLLLTAPVRVSDIVFGKFLAATTVLLIGVAATMLFVPIMELYGTPAVAETLVGYLGLFLLGVFFVALGMFMSSVTESQVIAAVSTLGILMALWLLSGMSLQFSEILAGSLHFLGAGLDWLLDFISINARLYDFTLGTLNFVPVFYFLSLAGLFVFLTIRVIERRHWK